MSVFVTCTSTLTSPSTTETEPGKMHNEILIKTTCHSYSDVLLLSVGNNQLTDRPPQVRSSREVDSGWSNGYQFSMSWSAANNCQCWWPVTGSVRIVTTLVASNSQCMDSYFVKVANYRETSHKWTQWQIRCLWMRPTQLTMCPLTIHSTGWRLHHSWNEINHSNS